MWKGRFAMRNKLQNLRKAAGFTQQSFSEKIGISRSYYSMIELGEKNPSTRIFIKIKTALHYPYDDIFFTAKRSVSGRL